MQSRKFDMGLAMELPEGIVVRRIPRFYRALKFGDTIDEAIESWNRKQKARIKE